MPYFNYFSNNQYILQRESIGYKHLNNNIYLKIFKHEKFLNWHPLFRRILLKMFPSILCEKDLSKINLSEIKEVIEQYKPFYFLGYSFSQLSNLKNILKEQIWHTLLIDLSKTKEEIELSFDNSARKEIRKAISLGLFVKRATTRNDLIQYKELLQKSGYKITLQNILCLWEHLHDNNPQKSYYEIFICFDKNRKPLEAIGIMANPEEKIFIETGIGRNNDPETKKLPAGDLIKWEIINFGIENNYLLYDLGGVNPSALKNSKEYGIYRHKRKWGGNLVQYFIYDNYFPNSSIINNLLYKLIIKKL